MHIPQFNPVVPFPYEGHSLLDSSKPVLPFPLYALRRLLLVCFKSLQNALSDRAQGNKGDCSYTLAIVWALIPAIGPIINACTDLSPPSTHHTNVPLASSRA